MRCLALFTGGLDSLLAVRLMQEQGIEVVGLYARTALCAADSNAAEARARDLGIELQTADLGGQYCRLLRAPRFGRLAGAAPCLDCRIAMLAKARELMGECGASFVTSSEVVGQRPRSATRDLETVAHHAGLADLLVRPLSAQLLPATLPETRGWVDRSRLLSIQGKSRKPQLELARALGIRKVPPPRIDCPLLSEPLQGRVREVMADAAELTAWLLRLLPVGRHVRVDEQTRLIVSRNRAEGGVLIAAAHATDADECLLATPCGFAGPTALIVGPAPPVARQRVAELVREYGRPTGAPGEQVQLQAIFRG